MTLIKTSLLNVIAVIIKMLTLLGINKVLAVYVGPVGYAALGQFQNAIQMITIISSGAINTGVVKYTAEHYDDELQQRRVWRSAGMIALFGSLFSCILILIFNELLAETFLNDKKLGSIFIWLGFSLFFFVFNALFLAILNGKREIAKYVICNIAGSLCSLLLTGLMTIYLGLYGALVGLAVYQSLSFFVTFYVIYNVHWFKLSYLFGEIDKATVKNLMKYSAMAITSAVCVPVSHILIRDYTGNTFGWEAAGYWEAMWRLSGAYLLLVSTTLGVYYLPKLSELKNPVEIKKEISNGYRFILPLAIILSVAIYLMKDLIIVLLFSDSFLPMGELFFWQLIGDTLKIVSLLLAYVLVAKTLTKAYIISEVGFSILFYILVVTCSDSFGFKGLAIAHFINYLMHILVMFFILKKNKVI